MSTKINESTKCEKKDILNQGVVVSRQYQGPGFTNVYSTLKIMDENGGYSKQGLPYRGKVSLR